MKQLTSANGVDLLRPSEAERGAALSQVLSHLKACSYHFVPPTPATHRRVLRRDAKPTATNLRDIFGWSRPFSAEALPPSVLSDLRVAGELIEDEGSFRSGVRVASLGGDLFLHDAFPPTAENAVFFGPDTYRFANFLREEASDGGGIQTLVDVGGGSGAGAVVAAKAFPAERVVVTDINARALAFARVNLASAGVRATFLHGSGLDPVCEVSDLIVANPPFIADTAGRTYRDGGSLRGAELSIAWARQACRRLRPGGRFLLYSGSAIVHGEDLLHAELRKGLDPTAFSLSYREIDPDIFGGQLDAEGYEEVERIAAISAVITRKP